MATSKVNYIGNLRTTSIHLGSNNEVISDAPIDNQGQGQTFSPSDFCATSLAMCMLTIAGIHTQKYDYKIDGTVAEVTKEMVSNPRRISRIIVNITFNCDRPLSENEKSALENAALTCPVAKSLHPDLDQKVSFYYS